MRENDCELWIYIPNPNIITGPTFRGKVNATISCDLHSRCRTVIFINIENEKQDRNGSNSGLEAYCELIVVGRTELENVAGESEFADVRTSLEREI